MRIYLTLSKMFAHRHSANHAPDWTFCDQQQTQGLSRLKTNFKNRWNSRLFKTRTNPVSNTKRHYRWHAIRNAMAFEYLTTWVDKFRKTQQNWIHAMATRGLMDPSGGGTLRPCYHAIAWILSLVRSMLLVLGRPFERNLKTSGYWTISSLNWKTQNVVE